MLHYIAHMDSMGNGKNEHQQTVEKPDRQKNDLERGQGYQDVRLMFMLFLLQKK